MTHAPIADFTSFLTLDTDLIQTAAPPLGIDKEARDDSDEKFHNDEPKDAIARDRRAHIVEVGYCT